MIRMFGGETAPTGKTSCSLHATSHHHRQPRFRRKRKSENSDSPTTLPAEPYGGGPSNSAHTFRRPSAPTRHTRSLSAPSNAALTRVPRSRGRRPRSPEVARCYLCKRELPVDEVSPDRPGLTVPLLRPRAVARADAEGLQAAKVCATLTSTRVLVALSALQLPLRARRRR